MRYFFFLVFSLSSAFFNGELYAASEKIYSWLDANGVQVFSDIARDGAEEINIRVSNNINSSGSSSKSSLPETVIQSSYQVEITQPQSDATIRDNTGSVFISSLVKPRFEQGFMLQLFLDNQAIATPQNNATFLLNNVDRGEHAIKIELLNDKGKIIASSQVRTFFLHKTSSIKAK